MDNSASTPDRELSVSEKGRASHATLLQRTESDQYTRPESDSPPNTQPKRRRLGTDCRIKIGASVAEEIKQICEQEGIAYDPTAPLQLELDFPAESVTKAPRAKKYSGKDVGHIENLTISRLQHELAKCKEKIARLTVDLEEEHRWNAQVEFRVKQDMFLRIMQEKEKRLIAEQSQERERRTHLKTIADLKENLEHSRDLARRAHEKLLRALDEQKGLRLEVEHFQGLNATMEADMNEMRDIESEEAAKRRKGDQGLPPAYGNLNDEDRFPPYSRHEDAGTLEVAQIKRRAREMFSKEVRRILTVDRKDIFLHLTKALAFACQTFQDYLDAAPLVTVTRSHRGAKDQSTSAKTLAHASGKKMHKTMQSSPAGPILADRHPQGPGNKGTFLIQQPAGAPYVAGRIVRLIHDLTWRFVSVCDHGLSLPPPPEKAKRELATNHKAIDNALTSALQLTFRDSRPLPKLKCCLTQTMALQNHLGEIQPGFNYSYFSNAIAWLSEQIECERALAANDPSALNTYERVYAHDSDDLSARASSRWRSDDESEDESEDGNDDDEEHDDDDDYDGDDWSI